MEKDAVLQGKPDEESDEVEEVLDELVDIVSQVDRATDIHRMGKFAPVVALLKSKNAQLRLCAAEIIGTCVQNNPEMQQVALNLSVLQLTTHLTMFDPVATVRTKSLFAVSCLVRNFPTAESLFVNSGDGLLLLCHGLSQTPSTSPADVNDALALPVGPNSVGHQRKCLHLLMHLIKATPAYADHCIQTDLLSSLAHHATESGADLDLSETSLQLLALISTSTPSAHAAANAPGLDLRGRLNVHLTTSNVNPDSAIVLKNLVNDLLSRLDAVPPAQPASTTVPTPTPDTHAAINTATTVTPTATTPPAATTTTPGFTATQEWQRLPEGQPIPPGLHVKLDMTTGEKWAKLNNPDEAGTDALRSIVVSDQAGPVTVTGGDTAIQ